MRRSRADWSSSSGLPTTADRRGYENSRPITAPICATSLAGPSRSRRAINEACRLAGTASFEGGIDAAVFRASHSFSASKTALVISSTKRGMPSVRSAMSCVTLSGSGVLPARRLMIAEISERICEDRASAASAQAVGSRGALVVRVALFTVMVSCRLGHLGIEVQRNALLVKA